MVCGGIAFEYNAAMVCGGTQVDITWSELVRSEATVSAGLTSLPYSSRSMQPIAVSQTTKCCGL